MRRGQGVESVVGRAGLLGLLLLLHLPRLQVLSHLQRQTESRNEFFIIINTAGVAGAVLQALS